VLLKSSIFIWPVTSLTALPKYKPVINFTAFICAGFGQNNHFVFVHAFNYSFAFKQKKEIFPMPAYERIVEMFF
jgi:hypothetical protein